MVSKNPGSMTPVISRQQSRFSVASSNYNTRITNGHKQKDKTREVRSRNTSNNKSHPGRGSSTVERESTVQEQSALGTDKSDGHRSGLQKLSANLPRIPRLTSTLLTAFIHSEIKLTLDLEPINNYALRQIRLTAIELQHKIDDSSITHLDLEEGTDNMIAMREKLNKRDPHVNNYLAPILSKLIILLGDLRVGLEVCSGVQPTDATQLITAAGMSPFPASADESWDLLKYMPKADNFITWKLIGKGGFGAVYKTVYNPLRLICAVKLVTVTTSVDKKFVLADKMVAASVKHPLIIRYYSAFASGNLFVTIMEYMDSIDVSSLVAETGSLGGFETKMVTVQSCSAIQYIHYRGFIHRDIKPSNTLINREGRIKLIDFDTCKECIGSFTPRTLRGFLARTVYEINEKDSAGTIAYMAPELLQKKGYGRTVDWWALGVAMFKMVTGRAPFRSSKTTLLKKKIIASEILWPSELDLVNPDVVKVKRMASRFLEKDINERLGSRSYQEIMSDLLFQDVELKTLFKGKPIFHIATFDNFTKKTATSVAVGVEKSSETIPKLSDIKEPLKIPAYTYICRSLRKVLDEFETSGSVPVMEVTRLSVIDDAKGKNGSKTQKAQSSTSLNPMLDVVLFVSGYCFWLRGAKMTLAPVRSADNRTFFYVRKVSGGRSSGQIVVGDIIVAVNGEKPQNSKEVQKLIRQSKTDAVITVFGYNAFRVAQTRTDVAEIMSLFKTINFEISLKKTCFGFSKYPSFKVTTYAVCSGLENASMQLHVISDVRSSVKDLYYGDVLVAIGETNVSTLTRYQLRKLFKDTKGEYTKATFCLMSPLRNQKFLMNLPMSASAIYSSKFKSGV